MVRMNKRSIHILLVILLVLAMVAGLVALAFLWQEQYMRTAYPLAYEDIIFEMSERYAVTPSLIAAVICVESRFMPHATSHAGAVGLMQLTPTTFEWLQSRESAETVLDAAVLTDPQVNIRYGTLNLKLMHEMFEDQTAALAAYNAGQGTVRKWLADKRYSADGIHLDEIPYEETAAYVKRVKSAQTIYRERYHLE